MSSNKSSNTKSGPIRTLIKKYKSWKELRLDVTEGVKHFRTSRDPIEEQNSTPPEDESIELHSIWVTEIYPPSEISSLKKSLKKLGWDLARETLEEESYSHWVESSRSEAYGGAWRHLGVINRPGEGNGVIETLHAKLPKGVTYASAIIRTVTPSVTSMTVQFVLDDTAAMLLENTLTKKYSTFAKKYKSKRGSFKRYAYIQIPQQKRESIAKQREIIYHECHKWINENIPGIFSDKSVTQDPPTAELITTARALPSYEPLKMVRDSYFDILLGRTAHVWESEQDQDVKLIFPGGVYKKLTPIFYAQKGELTKNLQTYGTTDRTKIANYFNESYSELIGLMAIDELLHVYIKGLSNIRDNVVNEPGRVGRILKDIRKTRGQLLTIQSDARIVGDEFLKIPAKSIKLLWEVSDFKSIGVYAKLYKMNLVEYLNSGIEDRIDFIKTTGDNVRDTVIASNGLTNDETNLRIQRQVKWLTALVLVIAILTLYVTWQARRQGNG